MRHLWPLAVVALLMCTAALADSAPSFFGDTGLILTPNGLTAERHSVTPQAHMLFDEFGDVEDNASGDWRTIGALFGLTERLELYLGFLSFDANPFGASDDQEQFVAHIKAQALREPDDWCNLAVGIRNMGLDTLDDGDNEPTAYAVATKTVCGSEEKNRYLRVSLGLQFANEDDLINEWMLPLDDGDDFKDDSLFGSVEWRLNRRVTLMGEMQEAGNDDHMLNLGARLGPWNHLNVDLLLIEDLAEDSPELAVGVSGAFALGGDENEADEDGKTSDHAASPSFFGDTGMILMPNAMTAPRHTVTVVYHNVADRFGEEYDRYEPADSAAWRSAGLLVGATPRLEVFAGDLEFTGSPGNGGYDQDRQDHFVMHAKAQALREPDNCLNLAVGVRNIGLDTIGEDDYEPSAYVVATKTLFTSKDEDDPRFLRVSGGLLLANSHEFLAEEYFPDEDDQYRDDSLFGGLEWMVGRHVTLLGEVIEVGDDESAFNFGMRLHPCERATVDVLFLDDVETDQHEFGWGASYRIPF